MAKVARGRISGPNGMQAYTAEELQSWSKTYEMQATSPCRCWPDDPNWLKRWADQIGRVAASKEKAREHKVASRRGLSQGRRSKTTFSYSGFGVERVVGSKEPRRKGSK
jgi:hypothetical protein